MYMNVFCAIDRQPLDQQDLLWIILDVHDATMAATYFGKVYPGSVHLDEPRSQTGRELDIATPTVQGTSNSRTTILSQNYNQKLKPEME